MAQWTNIPDEVLEVTKPIRSIDTIALRDNPIAIATGAAGAPRVETAALGNSFYTIGGVGTYAFLAQTGNTTTIITAGSTYAGSGLAYAGVIEASTVFALGSSPAGTWRAMGSQTNSTSSRRGTLFIRIS